MQSNIILFLAYSLVAVVIIHGLPQKIKRYGLLIFNMFFYLLCDAKFFLLVLLGIGWSYVIGGRLIRKHNRGILILGIVPIVGMLSFFKYYNFFVPKGSLALQLTMPLGISYYSFKMLSFMMDSYKEPNKTNIKLLDYANYVAFFPQIICGPISRFQDIGKQLECMEKVSLEKVRIGIYYIVSGMFKKLVIADRVGTYVDTIFHNYTNYPSLALWMGAFFFTIQIYCDFAGYSEIVTGICNLLGIDIIINFKYPYFSYSIKEFWNRWHISLSSWLRDYIYIPLGGNRKGKTRKVLNIVITFLVSGIWHGNTLSFVFWGLYHGVFNVITSVIMKNKSRWKYFVQILLNFAIVMFGWIFFKMLTIKDAFEYIVYMFKNMNISFNSMIASIMPFTGDYSCVAYLLTVCIFIGVLFVIEVREFNGINSKSEKNFKMAIYILAIIFFGVFGKNSFLYANF